MNTIAIATTCTRCGIEFEPCRDGIRADHWHTCPPCRDDPPPKASGADETDTRSLEGHAARRKCQPATHPRS